MTFKGDGEPSLTETQRWDSGVGWLAYPEETMQRASHALASDAGVWVIDPLDAPGLDDLLAEYGEVAGVVVGLDRHGRDAATVANRHEVPVYLPEWMDGVGGVDAPVERFAGGLPGTDIRAVRVRDSSVPPWREVAFHREADGTLVVPEAVGTAPHYLADGETLGVHPLLRLLGPPRELRSLRAERILTGHGGGVAAGGAGALRDALADARRRAPSLYLKTVRMFV